MKQLWRQVDELLRNREGVFTESSLGQLRASRFLIASILLGALYGCLMGMYGMFSRATPEYRMILADVWKVPALFVLTLLICFPSLYVFSTLLGSRLPFRATLNLLLATVTMTVTVLASLGPIVAFFSVSTESYNFMKLLNVAFFAVAGFLGVGALLKALQSLIGQTVANATPPPIPGVPPVMSRREELYTPQRQVRQLFRIWILIYALVGCQMGWVLRPFLGSPDLPFAWFRHRQANFFIDVWHSLANLFS